LQTGPSMRSHDDQVNVVVLRHGNDARKRAPVCHQCLPLEPGSAYTLDERLQILLGRGFNSSRNVAGKAPGTSPVPQYTAERTWRSVTRAWSVLANVMAYSSAQSA
jgi:hypothetical protein